MSASEREEWGPRVVNERSVVLDGLEVHVREVGEGPPVLLINGLGAHSAMWSSLERALEGFRVITFDAPGAGQSPTPRLPVGVGRLARLATLVLDLFEVEQADVLGYSMGGIVLQQLLADHPERVRRAVLVATSPGLGGLHGDAKAMLNIATPLRYLSESLYFKTIGSLAGGRARTDTEWVARHGAVRMRHPPTMAGYVKQLMSLTAWSGLPLLKGIRNPVLVVSGDDDPLSPVANAMLLTHLIPGARMLLLRDEGHLLLMDEESPALYKIRQFIAAHTLEDAPIWDEAHTVDEEDLRLAIAGVSKWQLQPFGLISDCMRRRYFTQSR